MATRTKLISGEYISIAISMRDVIDVTEEVYRLHGQRRVTMPPKVTLDLAASGEPNWYNAMPAFLPTLQAAGIKWVGGFINNPTQRGMSYLQSLLILNDPITGVPLAVMDGISITTMRTGASAAVAAKWLGKPDSGRIALLGAGAQGRSVARALSTLCPWVKHLCVVDVVPDHADRFVAMLSAGLEFPVEAVRDPQEAVRGADVVVTATTANEPLVAKDWLKPDALVITLGSYQELDPAVVLEAGELIVDDRVQCLHRGEFAHLVRAGKLSPEDLSAEIGEVLTGRYTPRVHDGHVVVSLVGLGSVDVACAKKIYDIASSRGDVPEFAFSWGELTG